MTTSTSRKRMNFMVKMTVVQDLENLIPAGERSNFVNEALEEKLVEWGRRKAFDLIDEFKKTHRHKKMTNEELLKDIRHGRK